jgi:hypothetical protein
VTSKKQETAQEFLARLERDPAFVKRQAQKEAFVLDQAAKSKLAFGPTIQHLNEIGYTGNTIDEIVCSHSPLPHSATKVLLAALPLLADPRDCEAVVRAIGCSGDPYDGRPLTSLFDATSDESLKWAIVNTIAISRPGNIEAWLARMGQHWRQVLEDLSQPNAGEGE